MLALPRARAVRALPFAPLALLARAGVDFESADVERQYWTELGHLSSSRTIFDWTGLLVQ